MAKRVIVVEITSRGIKLAEFEKTAGRWRLSKWDREKLAGSSTDELAGAIGNLRKKLNIKTADAIFSLLDENVAFQLVELPPLPEEEIGPAIKYKLEPLLNFPADQAVFDFQKVPQNGKTLYLTAAISKLTLAGLVEAAKKAGLALKQVMPAACALKDSLPLKGQTTFALVYLGDTAGNIIIVKNSRLVFARGISPAPENLANEIRSTFDFYREQAADNQPVKEIILAGEGALVESVLENLKPGLEPAPQIYQNDLLPKEEAPLLAGLYGAAAVGQDCLSFSAAPKTLSASGRLKKYGGSAAVIGGFLLIVFLAYLWLLTRHSAMEARLYKINNQLSSRELALTGQSDSQKISAKIISAIGARPGQADPLAVLMKLLDEKTPADIYFEDISYNRKSQRLLINGLVVENHANRRITVFISRLKQSPLVDSVKLNYLTGSKRFTATVFEFELDCGLAGVKL